MKLAIALLAQTQPSLAQRYTSVNSVPPSAAINCHRGEPLGDGDICISHKSHFDVAQFENQSLGFDVEVGHLG